MRNLSSFLCRSFPTLICLISKTALFPDPDLKRRSGVGKGMPPCFISNIYQLLSVVFNCHQHTNLANIESTSQSQVWRVSTPKKSQDILPIQLLEKNKEVFRFDNNIETFPFQFKGSMLVSCMQFWMLELPKPGTVESFLKE